MDFSGIVFSAAVLIPILIAIITLMVFYLVIRLAVRHALRDHFIWRVSERERHRESTTPGWSLLE